MRNDKSKNMLNALTSLRFLAACAILTQHAGESFQLNVGSIFPIPLHMGVNFFFVLSGFILA